MRSMPVSRARCAADGGAMAFKGIVEEMIDMIDEDRGEESHEDMRRKLWCDALLMAMQCKGYDNDPIKASDIVLKEFDKRFGKGEGE